MKTYQLLVILLLIVTPIVVAQSRARAKPAEPDDALGVTIKRDFANAWNHAYQIVRTKELDFSKAALDCAITDIDGSFLAAIVYPELLRYSSIRDRLEIAGMQLLYVNFGETHANFSVGPFQMKPGFARLVEQELGKLDDYRDPQQGLLSFKYSDPAAIRRERLDRLTNINWQLLYLTAFCIVVEHRFAPWLAKKTSLQRLAFFAAAYNGGFHRSAEVIESIASRSDFSEQSKNKSLGKQYGYHNVSGWAYEKLFPRSALFAK